MSDGGKGSAPRPLSVDWDRFESSWDRIFKKEHNERNQSQVNQGDGSDCQELRDQVLHQVQPNQTH